MTPVQQAAVTRAVLQLCLLVKRVAPSMGEESRDTFKIGAEAILDELIAAMRPAFTDALEARRAAGLTLFGDGRTRGGS